MSPQNLQIDRPLVVFDLETTGTDPARDRIVQLAAIRLEPSGARETFVSLVNPGVPIPAGATAVHGISDADVADQPALAQLRGRIEALLAGADLAGFNSQKFDLPLLQTELQRVGGQLDLSGVRHVDAMQIFHRMEPRDLTAALKFYCGKELSEAHDALADAEATLSVLDAQVARYEELPADIGALHEFLNPDLDKYVDPQGKLVWNEDGQAVFTFGKVKGRTLQEVAAGRDSRGYLEWILKSDFSPEVKEVVRSALNGVFPQR